MLTNILIVLAIVIVGFVILVATRPAEFQVARSLAISAAPAEIFEEVNDLRKWEAWSPWAKRDPAMKVTYDGPARGVGSSYRWDGNSSVGAGRSTIVESRPAELVGLRLDFEKPFKGTNAVAFTFKPEGGRTVVTWNMTGKCNFVTKAFGLFVSMDKMCGNDFEKGLASLKTVCEARTTARV